jgi:hypothetical protein
MLQLHCDYNGASLTLSRQEGKKKGERTEEGKASWLAGLSFCLRPSTFNLKRPEEQ